MSDFDFGPTPRQPAEQETIPAGQEDFQPGATLSSEGVSLFATDFRVQALEEGVLVDVSEQARQVGFVFPVAVTRNLWADIQAIPKAYATEDVNGRLWDVLLMAVHAVRQTPPQASEVRYNMVLHVDDTSLYTVRLVCEPGDDLQPVITLSTPHKDIDLEMGEIVLTEGALGALVTARVSPGPYLAKHQRGDWGELDAEDIVANDRAAREGTRVLSAYTLPRTNEKIWIITEWDRSVTTILLPGEY